MAKSKIFDDNYFQISGWMLNRLSLKGISLEVFAIIYGFSQDGESEFTGSVQYLCEFTGTSKPTVIKALKDLLNRQYIIKNEFDINNIKTNKYKANLQIVKKLCSGGKETLQKDGKETLPDNKSNIDNELNNKIKYIVSHLNTKAGTEYRHTSKGTQKLLKALLTGDQPFSVEDFICVIDKKCAEWKGTDFEKYLRPTTLFGPKFENYLNSKTKPKDSEKKEESRKYGGDYV